MFLNFDTKFENYVFLKYTLFLHLQNSLPLNSDITARAIQLHKYN